MSGFNLDVVQEPRMVVTVSPYESITQSKKKKKRRRKRRSAERREDGERSVGRSTRMVPDPVCPGDPLCSDKQVRVCACVSVSKHQHHISQTHPSLSISPHQFMERCEVNSSSLILCRSPMVDSSVLGSKVTVEFLLDNLRFDFSGLNSEAFTYEPNPVLKPLNQQDPLKAYRYNPGSFIQLEVSRR